MQEEASDSLRLDSCPSCGGWWFDTAELDQYREQCADEFEIPRPSPHSFKIAAEKTPNQCPRCCRGGLQLGVAAGIEVCRCPYCEGLFVSATNIKTLTHSARQEPGDELRSSIRNLGVAYFLSCFLDVPWN
jgi:Zn-finger nucleic acid-binding protein